MNRMFFVMLLLICCPVCMAGDLSVEQIEEYGVVINFADGVNVSGYQFDLVYDESMLVRSDVRLGELMLDGFGGNNDDTVYGVLLNGDHFESAGAICYVDFVSTGKTGYASVELENVLLVDENGNEMPVNVSGCWLLVDNAPVVEDIEDKTCFAGDDVAVDVNVSDVDGDEIKTFWVEGPEGVEVDAENCSFRWTAGEAGSYEFEVTVGDGWLNVVKNFVVIVFEKSDINMDGSVDVRDLIVVARFDIDVNGDGFCDVRDLVFVATRLT